MRTYRQQCWPSASIQTITQGLLQDNNIQALDQQVCPNNDGVAV